MTVRLVPGLTRQNVVREAFAGVTLVAIAVPLNIGYAQIAGLPAIAGLYSLILPTVVFALLCSTRQVVASPDAAAAALVGSSIGGLAIAGESEYVQLALAQAIVCGVIFGICALFKLGFLARFLSEPILVGFVGGLALDILVSQTAKMLGVKIDSGAGFVTKVGDLVAGLGTANAWSIALALVALVVLVLGRRFARRFPWALLALIGGTIAVSMGGLEEMGVAVLGPVESGIPELGWPQISVEQWLQVTPSAAALALVALAEGLLLARRFAQANGYTVNPDRDLAAFGAANFAAGVSGGFAIGTSSSRTASMDMAGSRTQLPTIVAAAATLLLVAFGTALLADIPSPVIGAIVAVAVVPLLGASEFAKLWRERKFEFLIGAACFLGALLLGPVIGIVIAFILSLLNLARRAADPPIDILNTNDAPSTPVAPDTMTAPGVVVVRFAAPLFFANASAFSEAIDTVSQDAAARGLRHVVIDCEAITDIDVTAAQSFRETRRSASDRGIQIHLSRLRLSLKDQFEHFGLIDGLLIHTTNRDAIDALQTKEQS